MSASDTDQAADVARLERAIAAKEAALALHTRLKVRAVLERELAELKQRLVKAHAAELRGRLKRAPRP